jgi:hypothetical protein
MPEAKAETTELMVEADTGTPFRFRQVGRNWGVLLSDLLPSLPVYHSQQVNTVCFFHIVRG